MSRRRHGGRRALRPAPAGTTTAGGTGRGKHDQEEEEDRASQQKEGAPREPSPLSALTILSRRVKYSACPTFRGLLEIRLDAAGGFLILEEGRRF